jgi:hypothetical protein
MFYGGAAHESAEALTVARRTSGTTMAVMRKLAVLLLWTSSLFGAGILPAEFAARRARLASQAGPDAIVFVFSARPARRNGDVDYPFRRADDMLYLAGIEEPETTLVLLPDEPKEILFVRDRNPKPC